MNAPLDRHPFTDPMDLLLLSRHGCCLCEGLEEKLRALELPLQVLDVDSDPQLQARYGLEVPLLALRPRQPGAGDGQGDPASPGPGGRLLPRVPPRLAGAALRQWLTAHGVSVDPPAGEST